MNAPAMVAPSQKLVVFRSLDRPEVGLMGPDDVEGCEDCFDLTNAEYRAAVEHHGHHCLTCRGYRLVHGYSWTGRGYPVVLVEDRPEGAASGTPGSSDPTFANDRRAPLPRPAAARAAR